MICQCTNRDCNRELPVTPEHLKRIRNQFGPNADVVSKECKVPGKLLAEFAGGVEVGRQTFRQEHGPRTAYYSLLPDNAPHPVIGCLCGWYPPKISDSWQEVGEMFDTHLGQVLKDEAEESRALPKRTISLEKRGAK